MSAMSRRARVPGWRPAAQPPTTAGQTAPPAGGGRRLRRCAAVGLLVVSLGCEGREPVAAPDEPGTAVYAAPGGWSGGDGTKENPYDLKSALAPTSAIKPGGTVWLRGGTYKVSAVTSAIAGTEQAPITVRSFPGEHAVIDGAQVEGTTLTILGGWTVYRDFEVTNSDPRRTGTPAARADGIDVRAPDVKLINLVVHDLGNGIRMGSEAANAEAYGNIVYYNGVMRTDGAAGHGISGQNKTGVRRITDNVVLSQFGSGIRAYASEGGFLDDFQLEGNVAAGNGIAGGGDYSILLGGLRVARRPVLKSNFVYDNPGGGINLGYSAGCEEPLTTDNYSAVLRGGYALQLVNCAGGLQRNAFIGATRGIAGQTIVTRPELIEQYPGNEFGDPPAVTRSFVRPNRYAPGRAHVIVYNWEHTATVRVDLAPAGLPVGAAFELRDVRNLAAAPVLTGTYSGGTVAIPLGGLSPASVIGWEPTPPHTAPEFAVFLLTSQPDVPSTTSSLFARLRGLVGL